MEASGGQRAGALWNGIRARGWITGLRLQTHDLAAGAGEAQNPCDHTELPGLVMLIACGASKEVDINWPVSIQPPARMPFQRAPALWPPEAALPQAGAVIELPPLEALVRNIRLLAGRGQRSWRPLR